LGILEELKKLFSRTQSASGQGEGTKMADKKMTLEEVNDYMKKQCGFVPRMFQIINTVTPEPGRTFADFYASIFGDGALSRKHKELMFMSGGVAYCSPRCIIHVIPAINAGATTGEIFEAASVGMILGGFVPGGPGIPYAFEYALKCLDIEAKFRKGEKWEYLPPPRFDHGVF
jgi:alkylhydroperoxidase/carboxymuconolactone decarboxylase family protein YurZ